MISFTKEALQRLTTDQKNAILVLHGEDRRDMSMSVGFDLPAGYLYFVRSTLAGQIHGGIAPNGDVST